MILNQATLPATDIEQSAAFYRVMGLTQIVSSPHYGRFECQDVARALILTIAEEARTQGASRYYWLTQRNNTIARLLYDKVGKFNGFIRYEASPSDA